MADWKKRLFEISHEKNHCITIQRGRRLVMESVEQIVFCDPSEIILEGEKRIRITGEELKLVELGGDMEVVGTIHAVFFEKK